MSANKVTISIPERLYRRLQLVADTTNRAIADILIDSAEAMLNVTEADLTLPDEVADELAAMKLFSDEKLWQATEPGLSPTQQTRFSELTQQQSQHTLTPAETAEFKQLLAEYDRSVLRRAQAWALLSARGHALPDLNATD